jgi:hypothetical protein
MPGAFPDDNHTPNTSPTGSQTPVQLLAQPHVDTSPLPVVLVVPAPDPLSPSWALQELLQQAATEPAR